MVREATAGSQNRKGRDDVFIHKYKAERAQQKPRLWLLKAHPQ